MDLANGVVLSAGSEGDEYASASAFWMLPLCYAAFGIAYSLAGLTPLVVFVNTWFDGSRKATSIGTHPQAGQPVVTRAA